MDVNLLLEKYQNKLSFLDRLAMPKQLHLALCKKLRLHINNFLNCVEMGFRFFLRHMLFEEIWDRKHVAIY